MSKRCYPFVDFGGYFDPESEYRKILADSMWNDEIPKEVTKLVDFIDEDRPVQLEFAAHNSIVFLVGRTLETKSGLELSIRQRGAMGTLSLSRLEGAVPQGHLWREESMDMGHSQTCDVALAVGVSTDVRKDVKAYLEQSKTSVRRLINVEVMPTTGQAAVESGAHAFQLAEELSRIVRRRSVEERRGVLHLFVAAPNTFVFYLGQLSKHFGTIQLYEHLHGAKEPGAYFPSIRIEGY